MTCGPRPCRRGRVCGLRGGERRCLPEGRGSCALAGPEHVLAFDGRVLTLPPPAPFPSGPCLHLLARSGSQGPCGFSLDAARDGAGLLSLHLNISGHHLQLHRSLVGVITPWLVHSEATTASVHGPVMGAVSSLPALHTVLPNVTRAASVTLDSFLMAQTVCLRTTAAVFTVDATSLLGNLWSYLAARNAVCACVVKASSASPFPAHRAQAASWMGVCGPVKLGRVLHATSSRGATSPPLMALVGSHPCLLHPVPMN